MSLSPTKYEILETFKDAIQSNILDDNTKKRLKNQIRKMMDPKADFSAMAKYFIIDNWEIEI